ncbi:hypothetical protein A5634_11905 [Mycobacterium asiaticum]|uniref:PknH-like extracellular domain-containing protein n=1 Tax=Mycobacterium asiaticum TaxID=1790 RepID=A0A1A3NGG4_MYCAS|nr:sensor domain-containing protein [Mycobacterium asiaticum]OBK20876.1 hypothetical protein A5634_11905 [Mycobacterium asiaticum]
MRGLTQAAAAVTLLILAACSTSVPGQAVRAPDATSGTSATGKPLLQARDLLLQTGESTPYGPAWATEVGANYFTSARPAECTAAVLFKDSPLRPAHPANYAESAYSSTGTGMYAESIGVYDRTLNAHDVVWKGFGEVSKCQGDVTAVSPQGDFGPLRLSAFATPSDGVLVWTMTRPDWTCDYGLAVVAQAALMMSACDGKAGFPMAEWAAKRRAQIDTRA